MIKNYRTFFFLSLLAGLIPLLWFKGVPIAGEEFYALDYAKWGSLFSGGWFNAVNWGEYSPLSAFKFQGALFVFLYVLGFSKYLALVFWYTSISVLTVGFMYYFLYKTFGTKYSPFLYFISSVYYLFSPFFLNISVTLSPPKLFFVGLPVLFIIFLDLYRNKNITVKDIVKINLILLVLSPIFVNIPLGLVLLGVVYLNLIFVLLVSRLKWNKTIGILAGFTLVYLALNIWWLIPTAYKQFSQSASVKQEASAFVTFDKTATLDALSLFGSWAFRENIFNTEYYYFPYFKNYDTFPGGIIRFIPYFFIIVGLVGLVRTRRSSDKTEKDFFIYYIFLIHTVFLFLTKGTSEPFGFVYKFLYDKFPLFWMFREPYAKFAPVAAFTTSMLFVYGAGYAYSYINERYIKAKNTAQQRYINIAISVAALLITLMYARPFIFGDVIWNVNDNNLRSYHVKAPEEWKSIQSGWKPGEGYYYQFPSTDIYDSYNWESGYNGNPYLMLTNAKLLNPEKGYSSSENIERKYITSYLYNLIINNPEKLIQNASRYNLSGIILQKDTVYNNYKYAFSVIQQKYNDLLEYGNNIVDIYRLNAQEPNLLDIVSKAGILNLKPESLSYYHLIREVTDPASLLAINSQTNDYAGVSPQAGKDNYEVSYALNPESAGYNYYLYGNIGNISEIQLDSKNIQVSETKDNYIKISADVYKDCCKTIKVQTRDGILSGGSAPLIWGSLPVFAPDIKQLQKLDSPYISINTEQVYLAPLPFFDPTRVNHIQFSLKGNYNYPVGMSLVQVDNDTKSTRYFANYKIQDISKPLTIVYDGVVNSLTSVFESPSYYVAIYGMKLVGEDQKSVPYPEDIKYVASPVTVVQERIPYLFALPNVNVVENIPVAPEYRQITKSLILVKFPDEIKNQSVLQFKNSHNPLWRLVRIDEAVYARISAKGLAFTDLLKLYSENKSGQEPLNIEYYSNGWEIAPEVAGTHAAIIFLPSMVQDICFYVSKLAFFGVIVFLITKILLAQKREVHS